MSDAKPASAGLRIPATIEEPLRDGFTQVKIVTVCVQPEDLRAALVRLAEMEMAK